MCVELALDDDLCALNELCLESPVLRADVDETPGDLARLVVEDESKVAPVLEAPSSVPVLC